MDASGATTDRRVMMRVENLVFAYEEVEVLHGVSLDVELGKITCVIGRNGVGKTTLLKNIMGVLRSRSGRILIDDRDVTGMPAYSRAKLGINITPQGREIFPGLTVEENLRIGLEARTDHAKTVPQEVYDIFPSLAGMRKRMGGNLSGGEQQQLAIGRALVGNPRVLLLDEPTEGIQPSIIKEIGQVLRRLIAEREIAILLVEQYLDFVAEIADDFILMNRGRLEHRGPTSELSRRDIRERLSV